MLAPIALALGMLGVALTTTTALAVGPEADLRITISGPTDAKQGQTVTYAFTVTNLSTTVSATAVLATFTIGPGMYFLSHDLPPFSCGFSGYANCALGTLAPGQAKVVTLTAYANSLSGTSMTTGTVLSDVFDPDLTNNSAMTSTALHFGAFLYPTVTGPVDAIHDQVFSYQLGVTNYGPGDSSGAILEDYLPRGVTYSSSTTSAGTCSMTSTTGPNGGPTVRCDLGPLAKDGTATATLVVRNASGVGRSENTVQASGLDGNSKGDPFARAYVFLSRAEVSVTASAAVSAVSGAPFVQVLTITNAGPDDVTVPTSIIFNGFGAVLTSLSTVATPGTCTDNMNCYLIAGQSSTFTMTVTATIPGTTSGYMGFDANVMMPFNRYDSSPLFADHASASTRIDEAPPSAPAITQSPTSASACEGSSVSFSAAASGKPAPSVQWQVSTDGGTTFTDIAGATSSTVTVATPASSNGRRYRAIFTNSLGSATSASATLTVTASSAPSVSITAPSGPVFAGSSVSLASSLTGGTTPFSYSWTLVSKPAGSNAALTGAATSAVSLMADRPGSYTVRLVVTDAAGCSSSAQEVTFTAAAADPDVSVTEAVPAVANVGATVHYTITIANGGPGTASNVTLNSYFVTAGFDTESATPPANVTCSVSRNGSSDSQGRDLTLVACDLGPIAAGGSKSVGVDMRAALAGSYMIGAYASASSGTDPNSANNVASATLIVSEPLATTSTTLSSSANPSSFGQGVAFTATVSSATTPSGTVQFKIDGLDFGAPVALSGGVATSSSNDTLAVGTHTVSATYSGDATHGPSDSPPLTQTVNGVPILQATPVTIDFGTVSFGTTATRSVTIRNVGTAALSLSTPVVQTGASLGFSVGAPPVLSLQPGGSTTVQIMFTPAVSGIANGSVLIASNGGDQTIVLTGVVTLPSLSLNDVVVIEGSSGTTAALFTVSLSNPSQGPITVDFATADGTARAGSDYVAGSGKLTFAPGETTKTVAISVNGDLMNEQDEIFLVQLTNPVNATVAGPGGVATILNDDGLPVLSISDVSVVEGNTGTMAAVFRVSLSAPSGQIVIVSYATADGAMNPAVVGSDYTASSGTLIFASGETTKTITVLVNGDTVREPNETFFVQLSNPTNATTGLSRGTATIVDDDTTTPAQQLTALRLLVQSFGLSKGLETSLLAKLRLECGPLNAFAKVVSDIDSDKKGPQGRDLTPAQSGALLRGVAQLLTDLSCR